MSTGAFSSLTQTIALFIRWHVQSMNECLCKWIDMIRLHSCNVTSSWVKSVSLVSHYPTGASGSKIFGYLPFYSAPSDTKSVSLPCLSEDPFHLKFLIQGCLSLSIVLSSLTISPDLGGSQFSYSFFEAYALSIPQSLIVVKQLLAIQCGFMCNWSNSHIIVAT